MDKHLLRIYITAEIRRIRNNIDDGTILTVAGLAQIDILEKLEHVFQLDKLVVDIASIPYLSQEKTDALDGIINFLDSFQDAIVESHIKTEDEVFAL